MPGRLLRRYKMVQNSSSVFQSSKLKLSAALKNKDLGTWVSKTQSVSTFSEGRKREKWNGLLRKMQRFTLSGPIPKSLLSRGVNLRRLPPIVRTRVNPLKPETLRFELHCLVHGTPVRISSASKPAQSSLRCPYTLHISLICRPGIV